MTVSTLGRDRPGRGPLSEALRGCRHAFWALFVFSIGINILLLASPLYMMQVYDRVLASRSIDTLLLLTLIMLFAFIVMAGLEWVRARLMVRLSTWLDTRLGGEVLAASIAAARSGRAADRGAQGLRDLAQFRGFLTSPGLFPILDAPWVPLFIGVNWLLHPWLGMLSAAGAVLLFLLAIVSEIATRRPLREAGEAARSAQTQAEMSVRNAEAIEAMGMLPALVRRWQQTGDEATRLQARSSDRAAIVTALSKCLRVSLQSLSLGVGAYLVIQHEATAGIMIGASIIMGRALAPVELAIGSWRSLIAARGALHRVRTLLAAAPPRLSRTRLPAPVGHLKLENVHFAFPSKNEFALRAIGFELRPGEVLGLIGPSAGGKTTLARLLVGAWQPQRGAVRLDGAELTQWDPDELGRHVGYLPQDVELFGGTVRDNIARMGEGSDEAVIAAARQACLHDMILDLPQGYDTEIGDGGAFLSGGQRQRVALARAVYGGPTLLVLDEPNASLDAAGENRLMETIAGLKQQGTTIVLITHQLKLLSLADKVLVLQNGAVAAFGGRDEMLAKLIRRAPEPPPRQEAVVEELRRAVSPPMSAGAEGEAAAGDGHDRADAV
jgi:ATP-binding cassette, subfamily C, type I secretion system permease/ATPase